MSDIIQPRVLKGFRDFLPEAEIGAPRPDDAAVGRCSAPSVSCPSTRRRLEYAEILLGKGGGETDKQVYRFRDHGDRDVALRFDLTVPFARFMAEHARETLPALQAVPHRQGVARTRTPSAGDPVSSPSATSTWWGRTARPRISRRSR
ncbi:MAG: ATP phosphoribosyltransferase regulatory subunit [Desulfomicrobium escambiense]|nr:ATP phosphoribosyltransferase regulatory subunit [Desulfomicrobium escambiense]